MPKFGRKSIKDSYMKAIFLILTLVSTTVFAQTDEPAVKEVINKLFQGMKTTDTAMIRSVFSTHPILQTVFKNKENKVSVEGEPLDSFLIAISKPHAEAYDERITFDIVKIDSDLAMVWAPYKFYVGEKFSHCGVDCFQLVKLNGQWKIQYLIDTRRRQGCE
jgi:hypothetical protein